MTPGSSSAENSAPTAPAPTAPAPAAAASAADAARSGAAVSAAAAASALREDLVYPDPLLDALVEVCRLHGIGASRAALAAGLPLIDGRMSLRLVERAAERVGMAARVQRMALEDIEDATLPCVLVLNGNRAAVLLARNGIGRAQLLLPETGAGEVTMPASQLEAEFAGIVIFVRPQFRFDARTTPTTHTQSAHWFWGALGRQRRVYRDVLWAALLINFFALVFPLFSMNVYDRVVPNHAIETLWALAIGVGLVISLDLVMRKLRSHFVDEASARIDVDISAALMERVLGMKLAHRPESVGSFASNLRGFEQVRDFITSSTVTALVDLPFALLFVLVLAWISPWLALPVVLAFVVIVVGGYVLQHRLQTLATTTYKAAAHRNALLVEALGGIETIKTQGAESAIQSRWERANRYLADLQVKMRGLSAGAQFAAAWMQQAVSISLIIIGVYLIGERALTMGALIASTMLASRALAPSAQIVGLLMQYQSARTAMESLDRVMATPVERPLGQSFVHRRTIEGALELRGVHFTYPNREEPALVDVNLRIEPGERVALIGKVGSGKSTLHKLMLGLYAPSEGAVLLDGIDLRQLDPADVRRNVAYVPQDVNLFYGSLRDNIAFGLPYADDQAILRAAEIAGLAEFVNRHPRGFELPVGERGEGLSGGQRQCVAIARAVLHNSPVLLLDEPTSAMDYPTEAQVTANLSAFAKDKTVVLVTHRTTMLPWVQRVVVIDAGRVLADGPRERVLEALQSGRIVRAA